MSEAGGTVDRIEREILIQAPLDRVWNLVSEPGWWIGDGDRSSQVVTREDDVVIVDDPRYGRFPVLQVSADAPHHVGFRSTDDPAQRPGHENSTLVEFFLTEQDGGTLLRVVETGFAALPIPTEQRTAALEGNTEGWRQQLGFAKRDAERA